MWEIEINSQSKLYLYVCIDSSSFSGWEYVEDIIIIIYKLYIFLKLTGFFSPFLMHSQVNGILTTVLSWVKITENRSG